MSICLFVTVLLQSDLQGSPKNGSVSDSNLLFRSIRPSYFCVHSRGKKDFIARNFQGINFSDITYIHSLNRVHGRTGTALNLWSRCFLGIFCPCTLFPSILQTASFPFWQRFTNLVSPIDTHHLSQIRSIALFYPHHLNVLALCLYIKSLLQFMFCFDVSLKLMLIFLYFL